MQDFKRLPEYVKLVRGAQPDMVPPPSMQGRAPMLTPEMAQEMFRPVYSEDIVDGDDGQIDVPDKLNRLMEEMIKQKLRGM